VREQATTAMCFTEVERPPNLLAPFNCPVDYENEISNPGCGVHGRVHPDGYTDLR
jgi:hypothetical protein